MTYLFLHFKVINRSSGFSPQLIAVLKTQMAHCVSCKQSWRKSDLSVFFLKTMKDFSQTDFLCDLSSRFFWLAASALEAGWLFLTFCAWLFLQPHLCERPFLASCAQPACSRGSPNSSHMANLDQMSVRNAASHPAYAPSASSSVWTPLLSANFSFSSAFFPK